MLTPPQADAKADAIMAEARAQLRRNNPPLNLMPAYCRLCPELKQFSQVEAFAIVRAANRTVARRGVGSACALLLGALCGLGLYAAAGAWWPCVPLMALALGIDMWRVRRQVAALCAERLPKLAAARVEVGEV